MQPPRGIPPVGVIFDCDLGNSIDDALALALLFGLEGKGEARAVALSITKANLNAAILCEVLARFHAAVPPRAPMRGLPIGLATSGWMPEDTPMLTVPLARRNAEGQPLYHRTIQEVNDTAEAHALIRNAATAQHDNNAIAVLAGPATHLAAALALPGVKPLFARKIRYLVVAGGSYAVDAPDPAIQADVAAAKKLFSEWPTPLIALGLDTTSAVQFPGAAIEKEFAWTDAHPLVDAYRAYRPMPYDAPVHAALAVLHAIRPEEKYFDVSEAGTIEVLDDGRTRWRSHDGGNHRILHFNHQQKARIVQTLVELTSAKPVPRFPRRPPSP